MTRIIQKDNSCKNQTFNITKTKLKYDDVLGLANTLEFRRKYLSFYYYYLQYDKILAVIFRKIVRTLIYLCEVFIFGG